MLELLLLKEYMYFNPFNIKNLDKYIVVCIELKVFDHQSFEDQKRWAQK